MNEWTIFIALFRATHEQTAFLQGQTQREAKMIFNRWLREGERLVGLIESMSDEDKLESITSTIEDAVHKLRENGI